jgi:hypothetical protein
MKHSSWDIYPFLEVENSIDITMLVKDTRM